MSKDPDLVESGISAAGAYELKLVAGHEVDGYVRARALKQMQRDHALEPVEVGRGNVVLRVVPNSAWHLDSMEGAAPIAAVAVDLAEEPDSRSSRIGNDTIKRLDRDLKNS